MTVKVVIVRRIPADLGLTISRARRGGGEEGGFAAESDLFHDYSVFYMR